MTEGSARRHYVGAVMAERLLGEKPPAHVAASRSKLQRLPPNGADLRVGQLGERHPPIPGADQSHRRRPRSRSPRRTPMRSATRITSWT